MAGSTANETRIRLIAETTQFTPPMAAARAEAAAFGKTITEASNQAKTSIGEYSSHSVSRIQAASASIRFAEGDILHMRRATEAWMSTMPAVSEASAKLFPFIGAASFIAVLGEGVMKAIEFSKEMHKASQELTDGFEKINSSQRSAGVALDITNDKLEIQIAKLEHKPANLLKLALDEDRKAAYDLAEQIDRASESVEKLLKEKGVTQAKSLFSSLLGNNLADTSAQQKLIEASDLALKRTTRAGISREENATPENRDKVAQQNRVDMQAALTREIQKTDAALQVVYSHQATGKGVDFSAQTSVLEGQLDALKGQLSNVRSGYATSDLTVKKEALDRAASNAKEMEEATKKAEAAQRKAWDDQHAAWASESQRSATDEIHFWDDRANAVTKGSANYEEASKKSNEAMKKLHEEQRKQFDEQLKWNSDNAEKSFKGLSGAIRPGTDATAKGIGEGQRTLQELTQSQRDAAYAVAYSNVQIAEQTGQMGQLEAATAIQTLRTMQYEEAAQKLREELAAVPLGPEHDAQSNTISRKIVENDAARAIEVMQDAAAVSAHTWEGGLHNAMGSFVQYAQDAGRQATEVFSTVVNGINENLSALLVGKKANFADFFRTIGQELASIGLQRLEAAAVSASSSSSKSGGSGSGGFFSSVIGAISGFRADGGDVTAGNTYMVGERGPEPFTPSVSGYVTSREKMGGSGDTHHWNIDARNASNPAETEAAVHRGIMAAAPHIISASLRAGKDQQSRMPNSKR